MKRFLLFMCILASSMATSPWDNLTANIAVVEFHSIKDPKLSPEAKILQNAEKYINIIKLANASTKLDLIVFPEATLRTTPKTAVQIEMNNPCDSKTYPQFVEDISCAARSFDTYLVVNLVEKVACDGDVKSRNCKLKGFYFYNTDVIFDREGTIVAKYPKYNLFAEVELDRPSVPEQITIETDFGIKFGVFTCFDILFKNPAQGLLGKKPHGVIFPSMWFSELPFLTALQTQQMWAYTHDVAFFGAGANGPGVGSGGSGIYQGSKRTILEGFVAKGGSKVLIFESKKGQVPPSPSKNVDFLAAEMDTFKLLADSSIPQYHNYVLDSSARDLREEICHGDGKNRLCCRFTVRLTENQIDPNRPFYLYHLVAFSGVRSFHGAYNGGLEICGLIACLNSSLSSCGQRFPKYEDVQWPITFEEITVEANFENSENKTQFPNTLLSSVRPIDAGQTVWRKEEVGEGLIQRTFSLSKPQNRILTFAIFGRDFNRDSPPDSVSLILV